MQSHRWRKVRRGYHESVDADSIPPRWPLTAPWPPAGPGACPLPSTLAPHTGYTSGKPLQQSTTSFHHRLSEHDASTSDGLLPHHIYSSSPTPSNSLLSRPIGSQTQYRRPPQHSLSTASRGEAARGVEYLYRLPHNPALSSSPPHQSLMAELIGGAGRSEEDGANGGPQDPPSSEGEESGAASLGSKDGPHAGRGKLERLCGVCGDRALGYNFNAITCESCKAFFRRNALKNKNLKCPFQDSCTVDTVTRRFCQKCRLTKCFDIGMKKEWIMTDEEKQKKKQKIEANKIRKYGGGSDLHGRSRSVDSSEDSMSFTMSPGVRKGDLTLSPVGSPRSSPRQREAELTPTVGTEGKGHPVFLPVCSAGGSALGTLDQACQKLKDQQMLKEKYMKVTPVPSVLPLQESAGKTLHHETSNNANSGLKPQAIVRGMVRDPETSALKVQRLLNQTDVHDTNHTNVNLTASFSTSTTSSLPNLVTQASPHNFPPPTLTSSTPSLEYGDNPSNNGSDVVGVMVNSSGDSNIGQTLLSMAGDSVTPQPHGLSSTTVTQSSLHHYHNHAVPTNSSLVIDPLLETEVSSSNSAERLHSSDVGSAFSDRVHSNVSNSLSRNDSPADLFKLVASVCSTSVADSSSSSYFVDSRISSTTAPVQVTDAEHRRSPDGMCGAEAVPTGSGEAVPQTSSTSTLSPNNCLTYSSSASGRTDSFEEVAEFNNCSTYPGSQPENGRSSHNLEEEDCIEARSGHRGAPFVGRLRPTEHSQQAYHERLENQPQRSNDNRLGTESGPSSDDGLGKNFPPPWLATAAQAQKPTSSNEDTLLDGSRSASNYSTPAGRNNIKLEPGEASSEPADQTTSCYAALVSSGSTSDDWSDFRVFDALHTIQGGQVGTGDTSSVVDSIVNTAVQAEYTPESLLVGATVEQNQPTHRRGCGSPLSPIEQRKLDELHTANASMMAPLSEDQAYKNQHNPSLINVINMTDIAIRRLIQMSKQLESFSCLCTEDQIALLKGSCTEMMILRSVSAYDADKDSWKIPEHHDTYKSIKLKVLKAAPGNVHVYEEHKRFILAFKPEWRHDPNIMLLLSAITLFTPSRPNVRHPKAIQHEQCCYLLLLKRYLECALGGCEGRTVYAGLLERINDLRRLNENHLKVYMQVNPEEVRPLLIEIFDLQQR